METIKAYLNKLENHLEQIIACEEPLTDIDIIRDGLVNILCELGYMPDDI